MKNLKFLYQFTPKSNLQSIFNSGLINKGISRDLVEGAKTIYNNSESFNYFFHDSRLWGRDIASILVHASNRGVGTQEVSILRVGLSEKDQIYVANADLFLNPGKYLNLEKDFEVEDLKDVEREKFKQEYSKSFKKLEDYVGEYSVPEFVVTNKINPKKIKNIRTDHLINFSDEISKNGAVNLEENYVYPGRKNW